MSDYQCPECGSENVTEKHEELYCNQCGFNTIKQRKQIKNFEVKYGGKMHLLPSASDLCQECATKHEPELPHNAQSLYYQMKFKLDHGRSPTWADAMAHCPEPVKAHWQKYFDALGIDINSINVTGGLNAEEVKERIKNV